MPIFALQKKLIFGCKIPNAVERELRQPGFGEGGIAALNLEGIQQNFSGGYLSQRWLAVLKHGIEIDGPILQGLIADGANG